MPSGNDLYLHVAIRSGEEASMNRLSALLALGLLASAAAAQDLSTGPPVTGTVVLPAGVTLPPNAKVVVNIYKVEPGQVITFLKPVGRHEQASVKSAPVSFSVRYPKSVLKDTPAKSFVMRASVYEGSKLRFETPEKEMPEAFTANKEPRQQVQLAVKAVGSK
jgi:uncharacterized lipoprotein YbaY